MSSKNNNEVDANKQLTKPWLDQIQSTAGAALMDVFMFKYGADKQKLKRIKGKLPASIDDYDTLIKRLAMELVVHDLDALLVWDGQQYSMDTVMTAASTSNYRVTDKDFVDTEASVNSLATEIEQQPITFVATTNQTTVSGLISSDMTVFAFLNARDPDMGKTLMWTLQATYVNNAQNKKQNKNKSQRQNNISITDMLQANHVQAARLYHNNTDAKDFISMGVPENAPDNFLKTRATLFALFRLFGRAVFTVAADISDSMNYHVSKLVDASYSPSADPFALTLYNARHHLDDITDESNVPLSFIVRCSVMDYNNALAALLRCMVLYQHTDDFKSENTKYKSQIKALKEQQKKQRANQNKNAQAHAGNTVQNYASYQGGTALMSDHYLKSGQTISNPSNVAFLKLLTNGNLVLYNGTPDQPGDQIWESKTAGKDTNDYLLNVSESRGLVILKGDNSMGEATVHASLDLQISTQFDYELKPIFFSVQDDNNLVIYHGTPDQPLDAIWDRDHPNPSFTMYSKWSSSSSPSAPSASPSSDRLDTDANKNKSKNKSRNANQNKMNSTAMIGGDLQTIVRPGQYISSGDTVPNADQSGFLKLEDNGSVSIYSKGSTDPVWQFDSKLPHDLQKGYCLLFTRNNGVAIFKGKVPKYKHLRALSTSTSKMDTSPDQFVAFQKDLSLAIYSGLGDPDAKVLATTSDGSLTFSNLNQAENALNASRRMRHCCSRGCD